jgi:DNA polymerase
MRLVRLASETDFDGWRRGARALRAAGVAPAEVGWAVGEGGADLFDQGGEPPEAKEPAFGVPRAFVDLAERVILHRSARRFDLLYRLLWRLRQEPGLMEIAADKEVAEAALMRKEVERSAYRMKQYVRFRQVQAEDGRHAYVAWIEPEHRVVEIAAPFFVDRFANMDWSILTPDRCAHWADGTLSFTDGVTREAAPDADALEDLWRGYYASIFNPARLKVKAMTAQMPRHLWRNLPEARVIPTLIEQATARTDTMVQTPHTEPSRRTAKAIRKVVRDAPFDGAYVPTSTDDVWSAVQACRRCDLWRNATQGVAGEGPARAALMFVGEQPGDQEDLAGKPFVGPAGQLFDRALAEAGVPRDQTYVTNAVKHFKFEPRGKRRIHSTPNTGEIKACRWWLDNERRLVKPKLIVALGATAAYSVLGRKAPVSQVRGQEIALEDGGRAFVTVHPSFMLRIPDAEEKARAYQLFVRDLEAAWSLVAA